ncbi:multiple epidermal growth factor-like domains protein 10 [Drosophila grimshawi]|uniref:GH12454 n=1 Tax=Drosophila grimshawi TaxID=7222 RepID=B4JJA4_DROGR|nr:multiple epidermal growth factor-like domains protein 10 [Drosophila grimshawi]EDV99656.1 GH12454 [Drosophila grimshawi]
MLTMQLMSILLLGFCLLNTSASAEELLELSCITDAQCAKYEHASCQDSRCICTAHGGDKRMECQPKDEKVSNIIGGPCPCTQPGAECDVQTQQCYCAANHVPSVDKRRCLPQQVALDGRCEMSRQCQLADTFSVCHTSRKRCICKEHFEPHQGQCIAILDVNCSNSTFCGSIGASICLPESKKCACNIDSVSNHNMTLCVSSSAYNATCTTHAQCQLQLGAGGICQTNRCGCRSKHYARTKQYLDQKTNSTICEPLVPYGAYCRRNEDCQRMEPEHLLESSMQCKWGECRCQSNQRVADTEICVLNSGAALHRPDSSLPILLILFVWLFILVSRM